MRYEFLPPYSPDMNPIKLAFSSLKYRLRRDGEYLRVAMASRVSDEEVYRLLYTAVWETSRIDTFGWFRHCGYI